MGTPAGFDLGILRTRLVFGPGTLGRTGELARELGLRRVLLVSDPGLRESGHPARAADVLRAAGIDSVLFDAFDHDPDGAMVARGAEAAREASVDGFVAVGGGSSLDCAKGANLLLTNGGRMAEYRGHGAASRPLLPMIGVPTTAGTGSEAQSYALISDERSHEKMACGDPKMAFRVAVLDPELTVSQPPGLTATAGYDALSHAVESYVTRTRNPVSSLLAREAFRLLDGSYERVLDTPADLEARGDMLLGAHLAGAAIEASMLGATHACANPLSAAFGTAHGVAIALMLPHVVRWNAAVVGPLYDELRPALADRLEHLARRGGLPRTLREAGISRDAVASLADQAALQWTGQHNPQPFDASHARALYEAAL
jgi:alcohol dehydrogenase